MRQGNEGTERGQVIRISLRGDERGQKLTAATARASPKVEEAREDWGGERGERGGEKLEVKITWL